MKHTLMFIDDETDNLDALERVFRKKYNVLKCSSGPEALKILKEQDDISVIISDQRMPEMTGVEFLEKSMKTHPNCIRILLTGYTDLDSVIAAINSGQVYRYITKPWDTRDLQITVDQAVEKFELESELKVKNQKLEKALNELKTLDQAKSQFMILINHELKTPLTSLLSFMELLSQTSLDEDQKKYISRINKSSDKLHEIIMDSLELVSSELEQTKLQKNKIQDKKIVDQAIGKLSSLADEKKIRIKTIFCEETFESDTQMLDNVLVRVIKNAIQHGDNSEPITIETSKDDATGKIKFEITNSGKDISKDTIEKILKPFALNENIMNHSKGLGLGLSISQSILKRLGSTLKIESSKKQITVSFSI
ncbi:MAG: hybrid sensor histidine kinase/response regulator [Bdellovibrionota bacterium]